MDIKFKEYYTYGDDNHNGRIRRAFQDLGYDTSKIKSFKSDMFYFTLAGCNDIYCTNDSNRIFCIVSDTNYIELKYNYDFDITTVDSNPNLSYIDDHITKQTRVQVIPELTSQNVVDFASEAFDIIKLYNNKNHDYGDSFTKGMDIIGYAYGVGRIFDKVNRLITLMKKDNKVNESIEDTLRDLASYSIMFNIYYKNKNKDNVKK